MTNPFAAAAANNAPAAAPAAPAATEQAPAAPPAMATPTTAAAPAAPAAPAGNLSDMFATGTRSGDGARLKDDLGHAVVVRPTEFISQLKTSNGPSDCVRADWIVLDGPNAGEQRTDSLIFNAAVRETLKRLIGTATPFCVGVVTQGEPKPGKSPALLLGDPTPEQLELAMQAVTAYGWHKA